MTESKTSRLAQAVVWAILICTWLVQALTAPHSLDADAVAYLNISYKCLSGNWHALVNGYWSPGFPFLLAMCIKIFGVGPIHEPLTIRLFAFASLIAALISFEYFLSSFFQYRKKRAVEGSPAFAGSLSDNTIRLLGYVLFFWITTFLTTPYLEQPDILVFAVYLIASALCMQLGTSGGSWWRYALLGAVLGLAYLIKAVNFPLAPTFMAALLLRQDWKRALPKVLLTAFVFAAVSAPFIFELSKSKGRLTYGDAGAVNYRHIMGMDGEDAPPPLVPSPAAAPHASEYTRIIELGAYPPWADPSVYYRGTPVHFDLRRQLNRIHVVLHYYFELYLGILGAMVTGLLILVVWGQDAWGFTKRLFGLPVLWLPALAGLGLYALLRVEGRMLAGFTIGLAAAWMTAVRLDETEGARRTMRSVALAVSVLLMSQIAMKAGHDVVAYRANAKFPDWEVATSLRGMGIKPGDRVSYMGMALGDNAWAHLGRVTISAEIPEEDTLTFWAADRAERMDATKWLAGTGALALVTRDVPGTAISMGWRRVGDTNYFILDLR